jgi:hypothetical protein
VQEEEEEEEEKEEEQKRRRAELPCNEEVWIQLKLCSSL